LQPALSRDDDDSAGGGRAVGSVRVRHAMRCARNAKVR
jgi:hypothetical protein